MNTLLNNLTNATNYKLTENGALARKTSTSGLMDLFALGGAYRSRSDEDVIFLFKKAFEEDKLLAMKCLFYLSDCRGGQGERRFFRVCFRWLANNYPDVARKNLINISEYRRWDDLIYSTVGTQLWNDAMAIVKHQLVLDVDCKTPSLLGKWMPSCNASSAETKRVANLVREYLGMTQRQYRKTLSMLRERINVVERLMSSGQWDKIEFDKIPSKAGLIYRNAFARRDMIAKKYETFAKDKTTKVNAAALYPYEIIEKVTNQFGGYWYGSTFRGDDTERAMLEKYWENQLDVLQGAPCKMICVVDTSGSMRGTPLNMAIGLGMYCAERIGGPFKDHYISFSSRPQLIKVDGVDFVDKVQRIYQTNLCENTNLVATFDLLKQATKRANPEDRLDTVVVISDMEIDHMSRERWSQDRTATEMEIIRKDWEAEGLKMPRLVYWNVSARKDTFLDLGPNVSFCSGSSPVMFRQIATGKTGYQLMLDTICTERYEAIVV